jgi:hypothetical protein
MRVRIHNPDFAENILLNLNPDPNVECGSGSGPRRAKMPHKYRKKLRIFMF